MCKSSYLSISLGVLLASCQSLVTEVSPKQLGAAIAPTLTVQCFISPQDTVLAAKVSLSGSAYSSASTSDVTDALVSLSNGSQQVILPYDPTVRYYRLSADALPIEAGKKYWLEVSTPDGKRVSSAATVPTNVPLVRATIDSLAYTRKDTNFISYRINLFFASVAGTHYYGGWATLKANTQDNTTYQFTFDVNKDQSASEGGEKAITSTLNVDVVERKRLSPVFTTFLFHTDSAYYFYHQQLRTQLTSNTLSEPTAVYTNIQDGYGCFAAYNASSLILRGK